jgi:GT2 family glycosyltransferase
LFDTSFFLFYEDSDFCRRARDAGVRVVCVGDAIIYHKASLSTGKDRSFSSRIRARNRIRFYRRYRHGPAPWLTSVAIGIMALWKTAGYLVRRQPHLIGPYWQGLREGWREPPSLPQYTWTDGSTT